MLLNPNIPADIRNLIYVNKLMGNEGYAKRKYKGKKPEILGYHGTKIQRPLFLEQYRTITGKKPRKYDKEKARLYRQKQKSKSKRYIQLNPDIEEIINNPIINIKPLREPQPLSIIPRSLPVNFPIMPVNQPMNEDEEERDETEEELDARLAAYDEQMKEHYKKGDKTS